MPGSSEDYRRLLDERHNTILAAIAETRHVMVERLDAVNRRLDITNGRLGKHDEAIHLLQVSDVRHDAQREGRMTPTRDARQPGDEELVVRMTPKMWAALVTVAAVAYTVLRAVYDALASRGVLP